MAISRCWNRLLSALAFTIWNDFFLGHCVRWWQRVKVLDAGECASAHGDGFDRRHGGGVIATGPIESRLTFHLYYICIN